MLNETSQLFHSCWVLQTFFWILSASLNEQIFYRMRQFWCTCFWAFHSPRLSRIHSIYLTLTDSIDDYTILFSEFVDWCNCLGNLYTNWKASACVCMHEYRMCVGWQFVIWHSKKLLIFFFINSKSWVEIKSMSRFWMRAKNSWYVIHICVWRICDMRNWAEHCVRFNSTIIIIIIVMSVVMSSSREAVAIVVVAAVLSSFVHTFHSVGWSGGLLMLNATSMIVYRIKYIYNGDNKHIRARR